MLFVYFFQLYLTVKTLLLSLNFFLQFDKKISIHNAFKDFFISKLSNSRKNKNIIKMLENKKCYVIINLSKNETIEDQREENYNEKIY